MAKNKKLIRATRDRVKRTGEAYTTARMHILAKLQAADEDGVARPSTGELILEGSVHDVEAPARGDRGALPEPAAPLYDYLALTPEGEPSGMAVLLEWPLPGPAVACDTCGGFMRQHGDRVPGAACKMANCEGKLFLWLRPDLMNPGS